MSSNDQQQPQEAADAVSDTAQRSQTQQKDSLDNFDPCAPIRFAGGVIGFVDHVNGAESAQTSVPISRYEAKLLVRHWLTRAEDIEFFWAYYECVGSMDMREQSYAYKRLNELISSGLVSSAEAHAIEDEVWSARAEGWEAVRRGETWDSTLDDERAAKMLSESIKEWSQYE